ncbi:MAG TPA: hypothetical protein VGR97_11055 [Candidatus Acidoferrales bacterium]|nr:hypothetical protein [Candidatus Acidoferrales bacterium]
MADTIQIEPASDGTFRVRVSDGKLETSHVVTLKCADYDRISSGKVEPAELVRMAFEFLLENEPKESILGRFDLPLIGRYFPNFEPEMKRRLANR